uniref:Uncharacterized protein n=1 Tax=Lepeophtheirus salmonis TaxID=72036 RepID=A0A0K2TAB8_LEPSM
MCARAVDSLRTSGKSCGQTGPNSVAERMFLHGETVTGGMKRREPIGGAAKGMPL